MTNREEMSEDPKEDGKTISTNSLKPKKGKKDKYDLKNNSLKKKLKTTKNGKKMKKSFQRSGRIFGSKTVRVGVLTPNHTPQFAIE